MNLNSSTGTKPRRLKDQLRELAGDAILAAAEQVFVEEGLQGARMEHIAARAGVAVGTLYNHFADRGALLAALIERRRTAMLGRLDHALAEGKGKPFPVQLRSFLGAFFSEIADGRLVLLAAEADKLADQKELQARKQYTQLRLKELVKRGVAAHALRPEAAATLPLLIKGMVHAVAMRGPDGGPVSADAWADAVSELVMRGAGQ
jgi:AcrR family transcriptional regulator